MTTLVSSMILVVIVQNALFFLIVWELMSISSFFLVIFESEKKEVLEAGLKYFIYMHLSVIFIMIMFLLLVINADSLDFNSFKTILENNQHFANIIFILAFIGFGIKAGFVPFHNWLPEAHPQAPSHISGLMSGVMIKTGIYGILRILTLISIPSLNISYFVLIISILSGLYGVLYAIAQHDLKKLLAYHSIENIGIIGIGIGIGMFGLACNNPLVAAMGFMGGILHILNHSIFKELLFFVAGSVYSKVHTKNIEVLGGLIKVMPYTTLFFLVGAVAICGLPPFNGFVSEFLIYFSMLKAMLISDVNLFICVVISLASMALIGTMAILCFTKAFSIIFLGTPRSNNAKQVKTDCFNTMLIPMGILSCFSLLIGVFPQYIINFSKNLLTVFGINPFELSNITGITQEISYFAFGFLLLLIVLLAFLKFEKFEKQKTWGCGYDKPNHKMQYSASSYASPFISVLEPLFIKKADIKKCKELFPKEAHFSLDMEDIEEEYIIKPIINFDEKFLAKFERIQSGNLQKYIFYGLIFLIIALIYTVIWG